jgi:hypothetical protein
MPGAGVQAGDDADSRWQQEVPAACMNAGRPISAAVPASQVARSRLVSGGRQPGPAGQRPGQRVGDVAPLGQLRELVAELEDLTLAIADQHAGRHAPARRTRHNTA